VAQAIQEQGRRGTTPQVLRVPSPVKRTSQGPVLADQARGRWSRWFSPARIARPPARPASTDRDDLTRNLDEVLASQAKWRRGRGKPAGSPEVLKRVFHRHSCDQVGSWMGAQSRRCDRSRDYNGPSSGALSRKRAGGALFSKVPRGRLDGGDAVDRRFVTGKQVADAGPHDVR